MSNLSDSTNRVIVIPDMKQVEQAGALFENTKAWIGYIRRVANGEQAGTADDVLGALTRIDTNLSSLQEDQLISTSLLVGLKATVDEIREEYGDVHSKLVQLEASIDSLTAEARDKGWEEAIEDAANAPDEFEDLDEAWTVVKADMQATGDVVAAALESMQQGEAAKEVRDKVRTALRAYEEASHVLIQYKRYCDEQIRTFRQ